MQSRGDDRVTGLLEIAGAISSELDFRTLLKVLAQKTAQICGADRCSIYLLCDDRAVLSMSQYASGRQDVALWRKAREAAAPRLADVPGFRQALDGGHPVVFTDPREVLPAHWIDTFHIRSGVILPLVRGQRRVGLIHLNNSESTRAFDAADVELARVIAVALALVIEHARLADETRSRLRDTETLLTVGQAINSTLDVMEVVRQIARATANALGADSSGVYLMSDHGTLAPLAGYRVPKRFLEFVPDAEMALDGFRDIGAAIGAPAYVLWSDDVPNDPRFGHEVFRRLPLQSALIASVRAKNELVGILVCTWWDRKRRFSNQELDLVRAIAAQAAVAIVNARLFANAEQLAISRERVRVAHELHDRLSQTVFSLGLRLEWCLHHTPPESPVRGKLHEVWQDAGAIMSQMRHLIDRLSPETSTDTDLSVRLRTLIADFEELSGIPVTYEPRADLREIGSRVEDVLFKTLQEGLANIVKHAHASCVSLTLEIHDGMIAFEVVDDGVGPPPAFSGTGGADGRHGLWLMAERIERFGGHVDVGAADPRGFVGRGALPIGVDA